MSSTRLLALLALLFAVLTTINAINKGGDAAVFFEGGRRLLHAEPLYEGSSAADGFIGPPFQAMFFAPFAAIAAVRPLPARILWHALNLACFGLGVWLSLKALDAVRDRAGQPQASWLPMLFPPLAAILLPALTNFEHQNMNALLLALIAAATWQMTLGFATAAGILVGIATALKIFPAFLILYFVARRYWTAAIAAIVSTIVLSVAPLVIYGAGFTDLVKTFWRLGNSGWPIRGNNQSLIAAIDRLTLGFVPTPVNAAGVREAADAPLALALFAVACTRAGWDVRRHDGENAAAPVFDPVRDRDGHNPRHSPLADCMGSLLDDDASGVSCRVRRRSGTAAGVRGALRLLVGGDSHDRAFTDDAWWRRLQPRARAIGVHCRRADSVCDARRGLWKKERAARLVLDAATEYTDDTD